MLVKRGHGRSQSRDLICELVEARRLLAQAPWVPGLQVVGREIAALHGLIDEPCKRRPEIVREPGQLVGQLYSFVNSTELSLKHRHLCGERENAGVRGFRI